MFSKSNSGDQHFIELPLDVWGIIFSLLDDFSLNQMILICKNFNDFIQSLKLWESRIEDNYSLYYQHILSTRNINEVNWKSLYFQIEDELIRRVPINLILKANRKTKKERFKLFRQCLLKKNFELFQFEFFKKNSNELRSQSVTFLINLGETKFLKSLFESDPEIAKGIYTEVELKVMTHESLESILEANKNESAISDSNLMDMAIKYGHLDLFKHFEKESCDAVDLLAQLITISSYGHLALCQYVWDKQIKKIEISEIDQDDAAVILLSSAFSTLLINGHVIFSQYLIEHNVKKHCGLENETIIELNAQPEPIQDGCSMLPSDAWVTIFMYLDFDEMSPVFLVSKNFYHLAHISIQTEFFKEKIKAEYPDYFKMAQNISSKLSWKMMYESLCWEEDQSQLEWINETIHRANCKMGFVGLEFKAQLAKAIQSENWVEVQKLFTGKGLDEKWIEERLLSYAQLMKRDDLRPVFYEIFKASFHSNDFGKLIEYHRPLDQIKAHPTFLSNIHNSEFFKSEFLKELSSSHLNWVKFLNEEKCRSYFDDKKIRKKLFASLSSVNQNFFQYLVDQGLIKKVTQIDSNSILEFHSFKHTLRTIYLIQEGCQLEWNFSPGFGSPLFHEYDQRTRHYTTNAMTEATIANNRYLIWYLNKFKPNARHANLALRAAAAIEGGHEIFQYLLKVAKPSILFTSNGKPTCSFLWIRDLAKTDKGLEISFVLHSTLKLASNHSDYGKMMKVTFTGKLDAVLHQSFILQVLHSEKSDERKMARVLFNDCQLPLSLIFKLYENEGDQTSLIENANKPDFILFSHFAISQGTCLLEEIIPYYHMLNKADEILDQILEYTNERQFLNQAFCKALSVFQYNLATCFWKKGVSLDFVDPAKQKTPLEILCEETDFDNTAFYLLAIKVFYKIAYPHIPQDADGIIKLNYFVEQFDAAKPTWALLALQNPELFDDMKENYLGKLGSIVDQVKGQIDEMNSVITSQSGTLFSDANHQKQLALKLALQRCEEHIQWVKSPEFVNAFTLQEGGQLKM